MSRKVIKFGGSNLKQRSDFARILSILIHYEHPVVVVSALFGVTDQLERMLTEAEPAVEAVERLRGLHHEVVEELMPAGAAQDRLCALLETQLEPLQRNLEAVRLLGHVPAGIRDAVLCRGELLSAQLLVGLLEAEGVSTSLVYPEEMGLLTNGTFGNARVDFERAVPSVRAGVPAECIAVVPGFYGVDDEGRPNLFGRGGSDYSAAAIARCLGATSLDIYKDVDGFLSSDPRLVSVAEPLPDLSYEEAAELAYFGAKILHPACIEPLVEPGIPLRLFNIERPGSPQARTCIHATSPAGHGAVRSVTHTSDVALLTLGGSALGIRPGVVAWVTDTLVSQGINIKSIITSQIAINLLLSRADVDRAHALIAARDMRQVGTLEVNRNLALVAAVGEGITLHPGVAARMFTAVAESQINIHMIASGASRVAAYFLVAEDDGPSAVKAIHHAFFPQPEYA